MNKYCQSLKKTLQAKQGGHGVGFVVGFIWESWVFFPFSILPWQLEGILMYFEIAVMSFFFFCEYSQEETKKFLTLQ